MRTRTRPIAAVGAALLTLGLLAGCASGASSYGGGPAAGADSAVQDAEAAPANPGGGAATQTTVDDRALVTTGSMGIESSDVTAATDSVEQVVASHGGRIDSRSESTGSYTRTELTVRVPAENYDALIEELRGVGTVSYVETQVSDVTLEQVDLEARIASLESSVASLRAMLAQATSISDMLEIESTLSDREAELQSLKAQATALDDQIAMSTLHVTISNDELANPTPGDEGGFLGGLQAGWNALVAFFNGALTVIGFLLPGLVVLAVLGLIAFFIVRAIIANRDRNRMRVAAAGGPAADVDAAPAAPDQAPMTEHRADGPGDAPSVAPTNGTPPNGTPPAPPSDGPGPAPTSP